MNINRIPVAFYGKRRTVAPEIMYKFNQKQVLELQGIFGLPPYFRVDFANEGDSVAKSVIGTPDGVEIPDAYLLTGKAIKAYIVLSGPDESVQTVFEIDIPVRGRLPVSEETPTPEQRSIIDELIAALDEGVERSEAAAQGAEASAGASAESALKSEGHAIGKQDGEDVGSESPYYHNNAAYFSGQAEAKAGEATGSARDAAGSAEAASGSASAASGSAQQAGNSAGAASRSAENAAGSATAAGNSANAASQSADAAGRSQSAASWSANAASQSAAAAERSSQAIQNMGVASETLTPGSQASVAKTVDPQTGAVTLNFGIPKGDKGDKGDAATTVANILDTDTGKTYQISQSVVNGYLVETFTEVVSS